MKSLLPAVVLTAFSVLPAMAQYSIPEPDTVFYGRVLNRASGQDALITSGTLTWSVARAGAAPLTVTAPLEPLAGGFYSYQLKIPHGALSAGLSVSSGAVALPGSRDEGEVLSVTLNGAPLTLLGPSGNHFDLAQALRASTFRLDLVAGGTLADSDGDGMADWWESRYGLDPNVSSDAALDPDGDGRTSLQEFLAGTNPNRDNRVPELLTLEIVVFDGCTSMVLLEAADVDTAPAGLAYTLLSLPAGGALTLRNAVHDPEAPDLPLAAGASFTQADLAAGRIVFVPESGAEPGSFMVRVSDAHLDHAAAEGEVQLLLSSPDAGAGDVHAAAREMGLSRQGIIADLSMAGGAHSAGAPSAGISAQTYAASYRPAWGDDRPHFFIGGPAGDFLTGGMAEDVLAGKAGDDVLTGGGSADRFVIEAGGGNDTITDFLPGEGDAIDLTGLLKGTSKLLADYVRITRDGAGAKLGISTAGTGAGYTDIVIRLTGSALSAGDLAFLSDNGNLLTGDILLPPAVGILASSVKASENGPSPSGFTVTRTGSLTAPLTVKLKISGSAANGTDYALMEPAVTIPAGQRSTVLSVVPFADALVELDEVVQVSLLPDSAYTLSAAATAQVIIEDMKPELTIEALDGLASVQEGMPAQLLVSRSGILDRSVFVRLTIGGTATSGSDYERLNNYINLAAGQTAALISVTPLPTAAIQGDAESVTVSFQPNSSYRIGSPGSAAAVLVAERMTLTSWRNRVQPGAAGSAAAFATADSVVRGVPNLLTYALPKPARFNIVDGYPRIEFDRVPWATDVEYVVESSSDLRTWSRDPLLVQPVTPVLPGAGFLTSAFRAPQPVSAAPASWMRVRVQLNP